MMLNPIGSRRFSVYIYAVVLSTSLAVTVSAGLSSSASAAASSTNNPFMAPCAARHLLLQRQFLPIHFTQGRGIQSIQINPLRSLCAFASPPPVGASKKNSPAAAGFGALPKFASPSRTRLFHSMKFVQSNGEGGNTSDDNDSLKWERMYSSGAGGDTQKSSTTATSSILNDPSTSSALLDTTASAPTAPKSDIRVITFDLDNTIWKTGATISDANDELAQHLEETFGILERSEKRMGQLFKQFPDRYSGLDWADDAIANENNGSGDEDDLNEGENYADIVQNVGQTEISLPSNSESQSNSDADGDNGVHIQASFGNKQGGQTAKKKPVYLTLLRKDAIRSLIQDTIDSATRDTDSAIDMEDQVDYAFEVWTEARCQSISRNFAPSAVPTLTNLRSQLTSTGSTSQKMYIGAITDGNSNPNRVPELSGLFDFVIRAEDVGASKPDKRVYKAAVAALMVQLSQDGNSIEEFFLGERLDEGVAQDTFMTPNGPASSTPSWKDIDEEAVEAFSEAVGSWWVHIGDDFFKDIVAAKELRMRTVWTRELIGGSQNDLSQDKVESNQQQQRSVTDLANDVAKSDGVLKMAIGESEFLSNSLHDEFSDAILDRFGDLFGLLSRWHEEGLSDSTLTGEMAEVNLLGVDDGPQQRTEISPVEVESKSQQKFCVFCGGQLPAVAQFCSHCGERQI